MEKLIYLLWSEQASEPDGFRDHLLQGLCAELNSLPDIRGMRIAVADSAVAPAHARRIESQSPLPAALLSLWVDSAIEPSAWETLIDASVARKSGYRVHESEPLCDLEKLPCDGARVEGMCQVACFCKPSELEHDAWLATWQGSHTATAIETQSTFAYRQNLVVQTLGQGGVPYDAIVEELFPPQAMDSDHAFFDSDGDEALLQRRMQDMMNSCARFIEFSTLDVTPMSEYLLKRSAVP